MIHSFAITNYLGDRIKLDLREPEVSGFLIKSVTGLGPVKATVNTTEVVTYKAEKGQDAIKFIYDNADKRIKVEYQGGKPYVIYMADADKKALVATYNLATALSDIYQMTQEKRKALKRITYLNHRMNKEEE